MLFFNDIKNPDYSALCKPLGANRLLAMDTFIHKTVLLTKALGRSNKILQGSTVAKAMIINEKEVWLEKLKALEDCGSILSMSLETQQKPTRY